MSKVVQGKMRASTGSWGTFRKVTYEILIFEGKKIKIEDRAPLYILLQKSIYIPWGPAGGPVLISEVQLDLLIWNNLAFTHYITSSYDLLFLLLHAGLWQLHICGLHQHRLSASSSSHHLSRHMTARKLVQGGGKGWQGSVPARYQYWLRLDQQLCDVEMAWRHLWPLYPWYC